MSTEDGSKQAKLWLDKYTGGLDIRDEKVAGGMSFDIDGHLRLGMPGVMTEFLDDGSTALTVRDRSGKHRIRFVVAETGAPTIRTYDSAGATAWEWPERPK
jgi:hypothetical protein